MGRAYDQTLTATVTATGSFAELSVERGANAARVNALAVIFSAALSVGASMWLSEGAVWGVVSGLLTVLAVAALFALIYGARPVRRAVMTVMHQITGE